MYAYIDTRVYLSLYTYIYIYIYVYIYIGALDAARAGDVPLCAYLAACCFAQGGASALFDINDSSNTNNSNKQPNSINSDTTATTPTTTTTTTTTTNHNNNNSDNNNSNKIDTDNDNNKALAARDEKCTRTFWLEIASPVVVHVPLGQELYCYYCITVSIVIVIIISSSGNSS